MKPHNPFKIKNLLWTIPLLAIVLGLGACNNNRNDRDPLPPTLQLELRQVNIFHFTWMDIAGETEYRLLEDPDGSSGYSVIATIAANRTSFDLYVSLPDHVNSTYLLQALRDGFYESMGEVSVTGSLVEAVGYFKASNTGIYDGFGASVALSGDGLTLAVGAPFESSGATGPKHPGDPDYASSQQDNSADSSGAVYVFTRSGTGWVQQAYLKAWNAEAFDEFGGAVAISYDGDTLAVGVAYEDSGFIDDENDNSMPDSGAVYIFTRSGNTWYQDPEDYIKASNPGEDDLFGESLSLSSDGDTLAVAAPLEDSDGNPSNDAITDSGAVYVFTRNAGLWYQQAYLKPPVIDTDDQFGYSLALSDEGNVLAVGNPLNDSAGTNPADNSAPDSGAVVVFTRTGFSWGTQAFIKASNAEEYDYFGVSVSLSGDGITLAAGAIGEDGNGLSQSNNSISDSGAVYAFNGSFTSWTQTDYIKAPNVETADEFGSLVSLSGDGLSLVVGTILEDSSAVGIDGDSSDNSATDSGAVYLFFQFTDVFSPYSYIKASNTEEFDAFGYSADLSWDGLVLAVGALDEDSSATGIGGNASDNSTPLSGAVYFY
ncbi:MAG: integrin [Acidobacteriota bacterium]|jgi:hypothetical protein